DAAGAAALPAERAEIGDRGAVVEKGVRPRRAARIVCGADHVSGAVDAVAEAGRPAECPDVAHHTPAEEERMQHVGADLRRSRDLAGGVDRLTDARLPAERPEVRHDA